jgi:serine/threonine-protein kinase
MPISSATELVEALAAFHVLGPEQLNKLRRAVQGRAPDVRALARELLNQGSLTAYQANLLLQGRGAELVLGPYLLLDRLGEGGMGQVFKARHQVMHRVVAIKIIRKEHLADGGAVQRFQREIRLAAQLDHPNLVRAYDAAQVGDTHFLVMEYAEGTDLHRLVQKAGPLPVAQACEYVRQAALGSQHAAERSLVHRDIKPSNLQLTGQGTVVKVLDMGLARSMEPDTGQKVTAELTLARTFMGTPDYIAPEQIADARRVDIRADIYSLGCTLYFLLAGRPPFPVATWQEKLVCHDKVEPQALEQVRPEVPPALGAVVRKMMAKRAEDRYATPLAVADALAPFCAVPSRVAAVAVAAGSQPAAAPVPMPDSPMPGSLLDRAAGYEAGWTVAADSTVHATPPPTGSHPMPVSNPLLAQKTVLAPTPIPTAAPTPPRRRAPWLLAAAVGLLLGAIAVGIALSGKTPKEESSPSDGKSRAAATSGSGPGGMQPPPPQGPVLKDEKPGVVAKMSGHYGSLEGTSIVFMPDGLRAVSRENQFIHFWDLVERAERPAAVRAINGRPGLVAVSPDGKRLAASAGGQLQLYDGKTYKAEGTLQVSEWCTALAFAPDGQLLAAAEVHSGKGRVRFYDHQRRLPMKRNPLDFDIPVVSLAFSLDGQYLATTNGPNPQGAEARKIRLWRAGDGTPVRELPGHPSAACWAAFFADGKRLFSASPVDGTLRVWGVDENDPEGLGKEVKKTIEAGEKWPKARSNEPHSPREVTCITFWPWGRALTGYRFGGVTLWNLDTGEALAEYPNPSAHADAMVAAVAISPDGHHALAALTDGAVYLYRLPPP